MSIRLPGRRGQNRLRMGRIYAPVQSENADIVALWCLRIFAKTYDPIFTTEEEIPQALLRMAVSRLPKSERPNIPETLCNIWREAERVKPGLRGALGRNLVYAGETLGLAEAERMLLAFATLLQTQADLNDVSDLLGRNLSDAEVAAILDDILGLSQGAVQKALHPEGALMSTGLLQLNPRPQHLQQKLELLPGIGSALLIDHDQPEELFRSYLRPGAAPELAPEDYAHVGEDYRLLERYLEHVAEHAAPGVNILVHGPSGTGKTQLARVLANRLKLQLYEVPTETKRHSPFDSEDRLRAYRLAQRLLARRPGNAIILFDEIEDLFPSTFHGMYKQDKPDKALVNELLENNPIPALWTSNSIWQMDPAAVRRFDYVLELGAPSRRVRRQILEKYLDHLPVRDRWIERVAENEHIAPALVERAARVVAVLNEEFPASVEKALERTLDNTLKAMDLPRIASAVDTEITRYRLDCLNTDADLAAIASGLKKNPRARFCLYGPPGTGKTAFGHYGFVNK